MNDYYSVENYIYERREELMREAANNRLVKAARRGEPKTPPRSRSHIIRNLARAPAILLKIFLGI